MEAASPGCRSSDDLVYRYAWAIAIWASIPAILGNFRVATGATSSHATWATAWYWMLDALPIDVAGPTNWTPAIEDLNGWSAAMLVAAQAYTVGLAIWGAAAVIRRWTRHAQTSRPPQSS